MNRTVDVLVVGAGPAGLAAAARLAAAGAGRVEVLERERVAGGVPRHCGHAGFGADHRGRPLDGPAYARRAVRAALRAGAVVRTGVSATGWAGPLTLDVTAPTGLERIRAGAVVLATGARERPRSARLVPGTRPSGVLTTGELQQAVRLFGPDRDSVRERVGRRAVVVGGEPVARRAVRTLRGAGVEVAAIVTELPRPAHGFGSVPVLTGTQVTELLGRGRLTGVAVRGRGGRTSVLRCDTVVFTGDWIPDHELARARGLAMAPGTRGPVTDGSYRTVEPGVFAVGNLLRGVEPAQVAAAEGHAVADAVLDLLAGRHSATEGVPVLTEGPLRWVTPGLLGPAAVPLLVRPDRPLVRPLLTITQGGVPLRRERLRGSLVPWRSVRLGPEWTSGVDPTGGPVVIGAEECPAGERSVRLGRMSAKRSAGLLVFRHTAGKGVEVLIGHMGGPLWASREQEAWSIPKGEYEPDEAPEAAARREFLEELGLPAPEGAWIDLGESRQRSGKTVTVWAVEGELDPTAVVPGTFTMEWPPRSGVRQEFPEIDRVGWYTPEAAAPLLVAGQQVFLARLTEHLGQPA